MRLHRGEIHAAAGRLIIRIVFHLEASRLEQRAVIFPGRIADIDLGGRIQPLKEVGADLQRAGAAQGLRRHHAACGEQFAGLAEQQILHRLVVSRRTFDRLVAARRQRFQPGFLGGLDGAQQRNLAVVVGVHADAKIDLGVAGIRIECFVETENGVTRRQFHTGEDRRGHTRLHCFTDKPAARAGQRKSNRACCHSNAKRFAAELQSNTPNADRPRPDRPGPAYSAARAGIDKAATMT